MADTLCGGNRPSPLPETPVRLRSIFLLNNGIVVVVLYRRPMGWALFFFLVSSIVFFYWISYVTENEKEELIFDLGEPTPP